MPIYSYSCSKCGKEFDEHKPISEAGKPTTCGCGGEAKQIIASCGYEPWQPFYCETQSRYFPTRESYQSYCRKKGLEGITASELRVVKDEARHFKELQDKGKILSDDMI